MSTAGILYTPTAGYFGPDAFNYTIADGKGGTASATVTIKSAERIESPRVVKAEQISESRWHCEVKLLTPDDLGFKRPGTGIPPYELEKVIGRATTRAVARTSSGSS